jgi:hypothetical protein
MNNFLLKLCLFEIFLKLLYLKQEKINPASFISLEDENDSSEAQEDSLLWAFEIFRHGARSPYSRFQESNSKDLFNMTWSGIQELTNIGKRQHFLIGYRNHKRYIIEKKLINKTYDPREIHIFSTNINRTIESAASQLQGLYLSGEGPNLTDAQIKRAVPPIDNELYEDILDNMGNEVFPGKINVVPIHILEESYKINSLHEEEYCKGLKGSEKKKEQREVVQNFLQKVHNKYGGEKLAKLVNSDLNVKEKCFLDYSCAYDIFDTIVSEYFDLRNMTDIKNGLGIDNMDEFINDICYTFLYYDLPGTSDETHDNAIYGMTKLFIQILDYMDLKIEKDKKGDINYTNYDLPKFVMYSVHDWDISVFERIIYDAFNINISYTYFASNAFLELYKAVNGTYYVKYLYNNVTEIDIPYEIFKKNITKVIKTGEEVDIFCELNNIKIIEKNKTNTTLIIFLIFFIILCIVQILYIILILRKSKLKKSLENLNLP